MSEAPYSILNGRDIYEVANQLAGYVDPGTPEHLAKFLLRESAAASDLAGEIIRLQSALASARETNQRLNRRVQQIESGEASQARREGYWELRHRADHHGQQWLNEFDRVLSAHRELKQIYEICADSLGLPWGRYHSVMDLACGQGDTDGYVYANVYLSDDGGIARFRVTEVVSQLATALASANRECEQSMQTIADLREANERMKGALETLSHIRDSNPSDAMADMEPLDYARHMLFEARKIARAAIQGGNDEAE